MRDGDVIFVKSDYVEQFAKDIFPKLQKRFILITHNSDYSRPTEPKSLQMLRHSKLIHWFAQNAAILHPKLTAIPIGLENRHYNKSGKIEAIEPFLRNLQPFYDPTNEDDGEKPNLVYVNFSPNHNKKFRMRAKSVFEKIGTSPDKRLNQNDFWSEIKRSKFVLSPPGNGVDCHRTWESILLGAIPIVANSTSFQPLFDVSPVYVKSDWSAPAEASELLNFKLAVKSRKVLLAQYWFDIIDSYRDVREEKKSNASVI